MDLVQGKLSVTSGLTGNANAFPMLKHWKRLSLVERGTRSFLRGGRTLVALVRCRARVPVPGDSS